MSFISGERCWEDVERLLELSKVPTHDLQTSQTRCIFFGEHIQREDIVLFEMDKHTLHDIRTSQSVCIKGKEDQMAVLVTDEQTYDVKECETSNTTLLMSGRLYGGGGRGGGGGEEGRKVEIRKVEGVKRNHYELKKTLPRLAVLREMLAEMPYAGGREGGGYTFDELLRVVQCSSKQLIEALVKNQACLVDGKWRKVDFDFLCQCFRHLIASVDECGYDDDDDVSMQMITNSMMAAFHKDMVSYMMKKFVVPLEGDSCKLNEVKVCKMYAMMMLVNSPKFLLEDFEEAWKLCVPRGMKPEYSFLKGVGVLDGEGRNAVVRYLPWWDLPDELDARFKTLFAFKEKWSIEAIGPYLEDLCSGSTTVTSLLLKHTRMSTLNNNKVFSCKKF